jgi:hypothetical protein
MGLQSCINTAPIPISDASHSISKAFVKSSKDKTCAEHNLSLNKLNVDFCSLPHLKPTEF